jgi:AraC-like DNA-binding protein
MLEHRPSQKIDALSSALTKIQLSVLTNVALDAGGSWAIDFPAYEGFTFNVVQKGTCRLCAEHGQQAVQLNAGDCFLLTGRSEFSLSNGSPKKRLRAQDLFPKARDGFVSCNGGGDFQVAGTIFRFEGHLPRVLFARLPTIIHIDGKSDHAAVLRWNLERFTAEIRGNAIGRSLVLNHLAPIMLLQTLRIYLARAPREQNWLAALSDPRLARVLEALQTDYQRAWSLNELAELAGVSRSALALAFKKKVGVAPMAYLMNWRIQIACELLRGHDQSLSAIASVVGYSSESAFSVAFRKVTKMRPGSYRKAFMTD